MIGAMSIFDQRLIMCEHDDLWKYISATYSRKINIVSNDDVIITRLSQRYDIKCWNDDIKNNYDTKMLNYDKKF